MDGIRRSAALGLALALGACGGGPTNTLPDESADLAVTSGGQTHTLAGTRPVDRAIGGTQWQWVEAHCTEGPLDLAARGFSGVVRVTTDEQGLLFVYDQTYASTECSQTVMQRATPGGTADASWQMNEMARIAVPATPGCYGTEEPERPGDVRMRGDFLEVYVQRSVWCGGFEVKMVYAPMRPSPLEGPAIIRHYLGHFNRQDALAIARLFADAGSLVEPFNLTATGGPTRHDGREEVYAWYTEAFDNVPWLALRVTDFQPGAAEGQFVADWEYMDPRLGAPFAGRNTFTIAAGEIFETQIAITASAAAGDEVAEEAPAAEPEAQPTLDVEPPANPEDSE